jgi:hypothetical protein
MTAPPWCCPRSLPPVAFSRLGKAAPGPGGALPTMRGMDNPVAITAADAADMVGHWLGTPPNGYLGQGYGSDVKQILQTPMAAGLADDLIEKCRADIPLASRLGPGGINVYAYDADIDKKVVVFEVAGQLVPVPGENL